MLIYHCQDHAVSISRKPFAANVYEILISCTWSFSCDSSAKEAHMPLRGLRLTEGFNVLASNLAGNPCLTDQAPADDSWKDPLSWLRSSTKI